jgi:hypothetical protein
LRDREGEIERLGAGIVAVGLGGRDDADAFRREAEIAFPLLLDPDRAAYRAAGLRRGGLLDLFRPSNIAARARARGAGHRHHRIGRDPLQLGGTFVLGPGPRDRFAHRSGTFGDVAEIDRVLAALTDQGSR